MTAPWFEGLTEPTKHEYVEFLDVIRDVALWRWPDRGLQPDETSFMDWGTSLVVIIEVPWVGAGYRNLQVGYSGTTAECGWGDEWVLDGNLEGLDLEGRSTPSDVARQVGAWAVEQLTRPVARADWLARTGEVRASEWRLADTDERLGVTGPVWRRILTRPSQQRRVDPFGVRKLD